MQGFPIGALNQLIGYQPVSLVEGVGLFVKGELHP